MTPRLLGGKEIRNLARKMLTLSLDKNSNLVQNWGASRSLTPSLLVRGFAMGLDTQMNVDIVRKCTGLLTESSSLLRDSRSDGAGTLSFFRHEDARPHSVQNGRQDL